MQLRFLPAIKLRMKNETQKLLIAIDTEKPARIACHKRRKLRIRFRTDKENKAKKKRALLG